MSSSVRQRQSSEQENKNILTDDSSGESLDKCYMKTLKDLKPKFIYNTLLLVSLIFYGLAGAAVFRKLELVTTGDISVDAASNTAFTRNSLIQELWNENIKQLDFDKWSTRVDEKLSLYEKAFRSTESTDNSTQWSWSNSWLFACTIMTTVGYGNIAPESFLGRIFCLLYALAGIPFFNVVLSSIGSLLTEVVKCIRDMRRRRLPDQKSKKDDDYIPEPIAEDGPLTLKQLAVSCLAYLIFGAVLFRLSENWSLFESFYYCFITLSTIGLGDYVPQNIQHTVVFGVYLLLGLIIVAMIFSAIEGKIISGLQALRAKLGIDEE